MADLNEPDEILVEFLRATVSEVTRIGLSNRHSNTTEEFNGNDSQTVFILTPPSGSVQCINSVTVDGTGVNKYYDYDIDLRNGKVTFATAPGTGTDNVDIDYDYGTSWVHKSKDREEEAWGPSSFPKIIVTLITESGEPMGMSDDSYWDNLIFQIDVLARKNQKCTISTETKEGQFVSNYLGRQVRQTFKSGNHRTHLADKLEHPVILRNDPVPFDEDKGIFRRKVELQMKSQDIGVS